MVEFITRNPEVWLVPTFIHAIACFWGTAFTLPTGYESKAKRQEQAQITLFLIVWLVLSPFVWPISFILCLIWCGGAFRRLVRLAVHGDS